MNESQPNSWGHDITLLTSSDADFFPGAYALINSAILNGFAGKITVLVAEGEEMPLASPHFEVRTYPAHHRELLPNIRRLAGLLDLPDGKYLFLDADIIIERPLGIFEPALNHAPITCAEQEPKYALGDVLQLNQCLRMGFNTDLQPSPYLNCGVLWLWLPRDRHILNEWVRLSFEHSKTLKSIGSQPELFFDQDILNLILRQPNQKFSVMSWRQVETGSVETFRNRPFPHTRQAHLRPRDQLKYILHGASLRRPWLQARIQPSWKAELERQGVLPLWRKMRGTLTAYERAWAYYACSEQHPIPLSAWAKEYRFSPTSLWKWTMGA